MPGPEETGGQVVPNFSPGHPNPNCSNFRERRRPSEKNFFQTIYHRGRHLPVRHDERQGRKSGWVGWGWMLKILPIKRRKMLMAFLRKALHQFWIKCVSQSGCETGYSFMYGKPI
ncbi:hypothetical protein CEXT_171381 [Caerostris extrusa]|uniref:Uncharacterized protein n=1 Tax=Caerostris extrusa TaxID=172846 RepID=A0AAV4XHE3_CAEEX|nr:hypothetical protein CEXT_171381 [Caerostris extrusa]